MRSSQVRVPQGKGAQLECADREEPVQPRRSQLLASVFATLLILAALSAAPAAASNPTIAGSLSGFELCPQFVCGSASFAGSFGGVIHGSPASGYWAVSVTHEALPAPGDSAKVTGGDWYLLADGENFAGSVKSGTITNNGDGTFSLSLTLKVESGGHGPLHFTGILSHNVFPPTIVGTLS
jgi:hypothetical protein